MANKPLPHLIYPVPPERRGYTYPSDGGGKKHVADRDAQIHAKHLETQFRASWQSAADRAVVGQISRQGIYLEFAGAADEVLVVKSLENRRAGIELRNVREKESNGKTITYATVYIPKSEAGFFIDRIRAYGTETTQKGEPKHKALIANVEDVQEAILSAFWTDDPERMPGEVAEWVELWIADDEERSKLPVLKDATTTLGISMGEGNPLNFPERTVVLIKANHNQLLSIIDRVDSLAEFRAHREPSTFFVDLSNKDQSDWSADLDARTLVAPNPQVTVCILDSGVNQGHPLLNRVMDPADALTLDPNWGSDDHDKHGTQMAGVAVYGDLHAVLSSTNSVQVAHRLESVKIMPPRNFPRTPERLYGAKTEQAVYTVESVHPTRTRVICMAVTSEDIPHLGKPTSWSAAVDQLAAGVDGIQKRLIVLSGGNTGIQGHQSVYPNFNITKSVHDPAQAWNALTAGASTHLVNITDPFFQGYHPVASSGDLSPHSATSSMWEHNRWPIKPEVLFEGGNVAADPSGTIQYPDDLMQISLWFKFTSGHFVSFGMTSSAAAQASQLAANIHAKYPQAWPETVRALIVHSASWTRAMRTRFGSGHGKGQYKDLLRTCGYGIAEASKALSSKQNSLTLLSEAELQPFEHPAGKGVRTKDMHLYHLPWPVGALQELGGAKVEMRVTLSYFIEPGPGEKGWKDRYRYPSHGLRFDLKSPTEKDDDFVKRINRQARDEDEGKPDTPSAADHWMIGQHRNVGSIHSDIWRGTAVELASSALLAIYPVTGWWRTRAHLGKVDSKCRYSLVVSITTENEEVDLYTPVKTFIDTMNTVRINA